MKRERLRTSGRWPRVLVKVIGVLVVLGLMAFTLRDRVPAPAKVLDALHTADPRWLLLATVAEIVSIGMFARQQRRLLLAFGVRMRLRRALAVSYSRSAIAVSLPAGSAVSAGYALRQYEAGGADKAAAATVMVLSGLLSAAGLALLYTTGALTAAVLNLAEAWHTSPVLTVLAAMATIGGLGWLVHLARTRHPHPPKPPSRATHDPGSARRMSRLLQPLANAVATARSVRPRYWLLALAAAIANWLTDLLCLLAATYAFGLGIGAAALATIYLTVQAVRQIPLTPGGIGMIEASLLAGLVSAGADESRAAAAVLSYRMLSCWLIIPVGLLAWLQLRRSAHDHHAARHDQIGGTEEGDADPGREREELDAM